MQLMPAETSYLLSLSLMFILSLVCSGYYICEAEFGKVTAMGCFPNGFDLSQIRQGANKSSWLCQETERTLLSR